MCEFHAPNYRSPHLGDNNCGSTNTPYCNETPDGGKEKAQLTSPNDCQAWILFTREHREGMLMKQVNRTLSALSLPTRRDSFEIMVNS